MALGMTTAAVTRPATPSARNHPAGLSTRTTPLLLREEHLLDAGELGELCLADFRVLEAERRQRLDDGRPDDDPREPLVVGRDDVPRRVLRGRVPDHVLVGAHVVLPVAALRGVG